jgi:flagellar hook-associated protein 3 FlgL
MKIGALGDLAQSYAMQSRNTALKHEMQRLTAELTSGQVADMRKAAHGNVAYINDLERSLTKLDGYDLATREAIQFADGVQTALGRMSDLNVSFRNIMLSNTNPSFGQSPTSVLSEAKSTLEDMISTMNGSVGGRSLFAGTATDTRPLAPAEDLLAALGSAIAGAGSVDDMLAAADAWFDDPAGFGTMGYRGSDRSLAPMALSDDKTAQLDLRADNPTFRDALKGLAVLALADDPVIGLTVAQQSELFQKSVDTVIGTSEGFVDLQAKTGFAESRLDAQAARNSAERATLEMARSSLLAIDPFETATELEQVQFQIESLYAITSRMSQLSLLNFI